MRGRKVPHLSTFVHVEATHAWNLIGVEDVNGEVSVPTGDARCLQLQTHLVETWRKHRHQRGSMASQS